MSIDYSILCKEVIQIAEKAGEFIIEHFNSISSSDIRKKEQNELVSFVDIESEKLIIDQLKRLIPNAGFIAEETSRKTTTIVDQYYWVIDPLDGTTNYLSKIPVFSTSIALLYNGSLKLGVIYDPYHKECFYTWENAGSFLNGKEIRVSNEINISESLIATGFPYKAFEKIDPYLEILRQLLLGTRGIRRLGSAALDMAYVACGRFEAFYEYNLNLWDIAAGVIIVKNAGGVITDFHGWENYLFEKTIIASNEGIYQDLFEIISSKFKS